MTVKEELAKAYPPEHLDMDRLNANLVVIDEELVNFRAALPILRTESGKALEAAKCSALIETHQEQRDELLVLIELKREWNDGQPSTD